MGSMPARGPDGLIVRDPVSELFDGAARKLLARAYDRPGLWTETRLANPSARHLAWGFAQGINLLGPDPAETLEGSHINARSAWARGFVRAAYYQHRWYYRQGRGLGPMKRVTPNRVLALRFQVGRMMPPRGVVPAGRVVALQVLPGGQAARRAVARLGDDERIFTADGLHGGRAAVPVE